MSREEIKGAVAATTLSGAINNSVTSLTVADGTGWPTGSPGPFVATIDRGLSTEEKILVTSRSTNTLSTITRGYDGTTAQNHANGAAIEHTISAALLDEANRVVSERQGNIGLASAATIASQSKVTGDSVVRFKRQTDGQMEWGSGSGATDILLRRLQADVLELQDELRLLRATNVQILSSRVGAESINRFDIDASGKQQWGSGSGAVDTNLYRASADKLKTDDAFEVASAFTGLSTAAITGLLTSSNLRSGTGTPEGAVTAPVGTLFERTDGGAGTCLYIKESGAGNTGWVPLVTSPTRLIYSTYADSATTVNGSNVDLASTTVAAGLCVTGDLLRVQAWGQVSKAAGTNGAFTIKLKLGTTNLFADAAGLNITPGSPQRWQVQFDIGFVTQSSQRVMAVLQTTNLSNTIAASVVAHGGEDTSAENFSTSKTLALVTAQAYSDSTQTCTLRGMAVQRLAA